MNKAAVRFYRLIRKQILKKSSLMSIGKGCVNLIDVGSAGDLPSPWLENADKIKYLLEFEPRSIPDKSAYITSLNFALGSEENQRDLYVYKGFGGSGSSFYKQNYEYVGENFVTLRKRGAKYLAKTWFERSVLCQVERISCRTLDSILKELANQITYHFLKIDAQGAEYEILVGAQEFLKNNCLGLHLELFTIPLYKGIRLLPEVDDYLAGFGFELVKKFPAHGSFNSQHDCVFLKKQLNNKIVDTIKEIYSL